ncbi:MAG: hypothetical protein IPL99_24645 [Candidatus Competibacteraceae bacterium]|nr:hypothetical protein [Candidatus Competibacteraceae bacterium]
MQWTLEKQHIEYLGVERRIELLLFVVAIALEQNGFFDLSQACLLSVACPVDDVSLPSKPVHSTHLDPGAAAPI